MGNNLQFWLGKYSSRVCGVLNVCEQFLDTVWGFIYEVERLLILARIIMLFYYERLGSFGVF